jgi:hypothetical protein
LERRDTVRVRADLARVHHPRGTFEAHDLDVDLSTPNWELEKLEATRTEIYLKVRGAGGDEPEPGAAAGRRPDAPVTFAGLNADRGRRIRERFEALAGLVARRLPVGGGVDLEGVHVIVQYGDQALNLGPARLRGTRSEESVAFSFSPGSASGPESQLVDFELVLPIAAGEVALRAAGGPIALSRLGVHEGDFGLAGVDRALLRLELEGKLSADGESAEVSTTGEMRGITWHHPKVAPDPLTGIEFSWAGRGGLKLDGSALHVEQGEVTFGAVTATAKGALTRERGRLVAAASLDVPVASCEDMFRSLPVAIVPLLQGARFGGSFSWQASLKIDTDKPAATEAKWRMQNDCRLLEVPTNADPKIFKQPFSREVPGTDGQLLTVWSGPGAEEWVPLSQISRYLEIAVLVTEDGGFRAHRGFDQQAIESAIRQNLRAGKYVRGASTISMQLAKNLYLSPDKQLARKVQEALLTMLLEQELQKDEILELYFNVIEFGPDVWGVGMAADHYFNAKPRELSLAQSFFLASLLPNPTANHFQEDGFLKPGWRKYLRRLMQIAHERERISAEELDLGLSQEVQLGVPNLLAEEAFEGGWPGAAHPGGPEREPDWENELRSDGD